MSIYRKQWNLKFQKKYQERNLCEKLIVFFILVSWLEFAQCLSSWENIFTKISFSHSSDIDLLILLYRFSTSNVT